MDRTHFTTIIVGAGPAGVTCGYQLAKNSQDCLVIDKCDFPREKLCGGGLTPKGHRLLNYIYGNINYEYRNVDRMEIISRGILKSSFAIYEGIRTVERKIFDNILLQEYLKIGGLFLKAKVRDFEEAGDKVLVKLQDGKILSCDRLIGADSANSVIRKKLQPVYNRGIICVEKKINNTAEKNIKIYFEKHYKNGYGYVFPNPTGCVVGLGHLRTDQNDFKKSLIEWGMISDDRVKGAYIPMLGRLNYEFRDKVWLIGDAGGYIDSMTGEGLYYALKTGDNAATAIMKKISFSEANKAIIKQVKISRWMSLIFYFRPVNSLFMWMCTKERLRRRMEYKINDFLKW